MEKDLKASPTVQPVGETGGLRGAESSANNQKPARTQGVKVGTRKMKTYIAIIAEDKSGPAYGVGTTEEEARAEAREYGFDDGIAIEITEESFNRILEGNPDAVEEVE